MISTKLFSEKMIFSKIFFGVWFARKNYEMQKSEFGKCRRNPATSDRRCRIPATKFVRIWPKWQDSCWNLPDQWLDQVISGRIPAILARSYRNLPDPAGSMAESGHTRPDPGRFGQI
jgi:hypothetical protein